MMRCASLLHCDLLCSAVTEDKHAMLHLLLLCGTVQCCHVAENKSPAVSQSLCFTVFTHNTRAAPCLPCTARAMMCCTGAVLWLARVCAAVHPSSLTGLGFTVLLHPGLELTSDSAGLAWAYW